MCVCVCVCMYVCAYACVHMSACMLGGGGSGGTHYPSSLMGGLVICRIISSVYLGWGDGSPFLRDMWEEVVLNTSLPSFHFFQVGFHPDTVHWALKSTN